MARQVTLYGQFATLADIEGVAQTIRTLGGVPTTPIHLRIARVNHKLEVGGVDVDLSAPAAQVELPLPATGVIDTSGVDAPEEFR